jgi:hypothetical protein
MKPGRSRRTARARMSWEGRKRLKASRARRARKVQKVFRRGLRG